MHHKSQLPIATVHKLQTFIKTNLKRFEMICQNAWTIFYCAHVLEQKTFSFLLKKSGFVLNNCFIFANSSLINEPTKTIERSSSKYLMELD